MDLTNNIDTQTTQLSPRRKWGMLGILSLALAIIILDTTILNVALSSIIQDLHTDIQKIQWVITAYSLTLAALTITGGRLGDLFGRKRMFVAGAVLFAIGSFLASISTNVAMLVAGEAIIEGIGAALMMPATSSLLVVNFKGRERAIAFGIWGGIAGAAAALGPILGGYLTTHYSWRWGFRVNLFVVLALIIGSVLIPESRDTKEKKELDGVGILLSATGMLSLVFGIIEASTYGWWKAKAAFILWGHTLTMPFDLSVVPAFMAVGIIILIFFALTQHDREVAGHTPLVSMSIFKNRPFAAGVSTTTVMSLGQTGLIFALPVFLQSVRGLDAFHTGLALLPMSLALLIVAPLSAVLGKKISGKLLINIGLLVNIAAYIVLRYTLSVDTTATDLIPGLALFGIGMGLVMSQVNNLTLSAVPIHQAGEASGVNNTLRQVGATLGSAIIGTILIGTLGANLLTEVNQSPVIPDNMKPAIAEAMQSQTSEVEFGGGAHLQQKISPEIGQELTRIGHAATVTANKESLLYGVIFSILGFLVSLFLPSSQTKSAEQTSPSEKKSVVFPKSEQKLDTTLLSELIQTDIELQGQGKPSLGSDVRLLIDAAKTNANFLQMLHLPISRARSLWNAGFGTALGMKDFATYQHSIPPIPVALQAEDPAYPHLILVDARLSAAAACRLLNVQPKGNEQTQNMKMLQERGMVYWLRCQDGSRFQSKSVKEAEQLFSLQEQGLTVAEGLALYLQYPDSLHNHYIDLAASPHEGAENSTACLGNWNNQVELRWRWRDHADPRCKVATKKK